MTIIKAGSARKDVGAPHPELGRYEASLISDTGGLTQFGALVETLPPGSRSSFLHWHSAEDEMVDVLTGRITVHEGEVTTEIGPGDAACFKASVPVGHCLENTSDDVASYLVIGTRSSSDTVTYPGRNRRLVRENGTRRWVDDTGAPADSL